MAKKPPPRASFRESLARAKQLMAQILPWKAEQWVAQDAVRVGKSRCDSRVTVWRHKVDTYRLHVQQPPNEMDRLQVLDLSGSQLEALRELLNQAPS